MSCKHNNAWTLFVKIISGEGGKTDKEKHPTAKADIPEG